MVILVSGFIHREMRRRAKCQTNITKIQLTHKFILIDHPRADTITHFEEKWIINGLDWIVNIISCIARCGNRWKRHIYTNTTDTSCYLITFHTWKSANAMCQWMVNLVCVCVMMVGWLDFFIHYSPTHTLACSLSRFNRCAWFAVESSVCVKHITQSQWRQSTVKLTHSRIRDTIRWRRHLSSS